MTAQDHYGFEILEDLFLTLLLELGPAPPLPDRIVYDPARDAYAVTWTHGSGSLTLLVDTVQLADRIVWDPDMHEYYQKACALLRRHKEFRDGGYWRLESRLLMPQMFEDFVKWQGKQNGLDPL